MGGNRKIERSATLHCTVDNLEVAERGEDQEIYASSSIPFTIVLVDSGVRVATNIAGSNRRISVLLKAMSTVLRTH